MSKRGLILVSMLFMLNACGESEKTECREATDCQSGYICTENRCVEPPEVECSDTKPCTEPGRTCFENRCVVLVECSDASPCKDADKTCFNGKCVDRTEIECTSSQPCVDEAKKCDIATAKCVDNPDIECAATKPCADETKMCDVVSHRCVDKPECSVSVPCTDETKICDVMTGKCVDKPECSATDPCKDTTKYCNLNTGKCETKSECDADTPCTVPGQACADGYCVDNSTISCISDTQCGNGYICDQKKCIPENACSISRTCAGDLVCSDGICVEKQHTTCDSKTPCTKDGEVCVAGKCVACDCKGEDEICGPDGTCVNMKHSDTKNLNVGDPCEYAPDFSHCEGNVLYTCAKTITEETHTMKARNCGAMICTESLTEGVNCHEPCPNKDDFYGECLNDYNSQTGEYKGIAFKTMCSESKEGHLIWTFTPGYELCSTTCVNGSCVIVPDDYGQTCTSVSYADQCEGNWSKYCYNTPNSTVGVVVAENCTDNYRKDGQAFHCDISHDGITDCVVSCDKENDVKYFCHDNVQGTVMSDKRICLRNQSGKLAYFVDSYEPCSRGCNAETGRCK